MKHLLQLLIEIIHQILFLLCSIVGVLFSFVLCMQSNKRQKHLQVHEDLFHWEKFVKSPYPNIAGWFLNCTPFCMYTLGLWGLVQIQLHYLYSISAQGIFLYLFLQLGVNLQLSQNKSFNNNNKKIVHCT